MGRKNRRRKADYEDRLGFNPKKYISKAYGGYYDETVCDSPAMPDERPAKPYRYTSKQYRKHQMEQRYKRREPTASQPQPRRGDIWYVHLGYHSGTHIQEGCRPAVIVSNDTANANSGTVTIIPVTSKLKRLYYPTHILVGGGDSGIGQSMALAEQITTISASALANRVGSVTAEEMKRIEAGLAVQAGISVGGLEEHQGEEKDDGGTQ